MKITLKKLSTKDLATFAMRVISSSEKGEYTVMKNHEQECGRMEGGLS